MDFMKLVTFNCDCLILKQHSYKLNAGFEAREIED